ncbi:MAG TPA: host attachment protein [Pseudomonadales bacterium]
MVLVAESSRARLFHWQSKDVLHEIDSFSHPASRLHEQDLASDKPGRTYDSAGAGRHAEQPPTDAKTHEAQVFARQLAERLESSRTHQDFDQLIVIAAPHFLGQLRHSMGAALQQTVIHELDKNLVQQPLDEILQHLPAISPG